MERKKRKSQARQRLEKRRNRREAMATLRDESMERISSAAPGRVSPMLEHIVQFLQDVTWRLFRSGQGSRLIGGLVVVVLLFGLARLVFSPNIGPRVRSLDVALGGMSVDFAATTLEQTFREQEIEIRLDGSIYARVAPSEIGIRIDGPQTAQQAKEVGLQSILFGETIPPVLEVSFADAQSYLLDLTDDIYVPPYEAGYKWENEQLIGIPGTPSRELDVATTLQPLLDDPLNIVERGRFDLITVSTPPNVIDPEPYYDEALAFVTSDFTLIGYDPFTNEYQYWRTKREEMASWLVVRDDGITVRSDGLDRFVRTVNTLLNAEENARYINEDDTSRLLGEAIARGESQVYLRIRYLPFAYEVVRGDSGFLIGRKVGIPFRLINEENPNVEWNLLSPGQEIMIPSLDQVMPEDPIPNKRIVVDLDRLWLVLYEDGERIRSWRVSSGRFDAPTSPGIYQILSKDGVARGSTFDLCNSVTNQCGQWVMEDFMSIYEVAPGLMNGFHGPVTLPNGGYLEGGSSQTRTTYGCIMSDPADATFLFEWSEVGTVVEIVSSQFAPRSELARNAMEYIDQADRATVRPDEYVYTFMRTLDNMATNPYASRIN